MKPTEIHARHAILSLSIFIALLLAFYTILIHPAIKMKNENTERIEDLVFKVHKYEQLTANSSQLTQEIKQLKEEKSGEDSFLKNQSPAVVAADLQNKIKSLVEAHGGSLISTHALGENNDELFPKITVKVHLRADIVALREVLYQIAVSKPLLFTENILIQKTRASARRGQQTDSQIEVRFDVSGYRVSTAI